MENKYFDVKKTYGEKKNIVRVRKEVWSYGKDTKC